MLYRMRGIENFKIFWKCSETH